jgi:hypothetical protein
MTNSNAVSCASDDPNNEQNRVAPTNSHPVSPVDGLSGGIQVGIDWLTLTMRNVERKRGIYEKTAESLHSSTEDAIVGHGYKGVLVATGLGSISRRKRREDSDREDLLLNLPGRALDWMRDVHFPWGDLTEELTDQNLCQHFWIKGWTASRIDIVMDTKDIFINPSIVFESIQSDCVSGPPRNYRRVTNGERGKQRLPGQGETVYLGGRGSSRMLRCYDKREEVRAKLGRDIGHLTRFELEVKQRAAERVFSKIGKDGSGVIPGCFSGWINFKDPIDSATRIERRRNAAWWDRLVSGVSPISLGLKRGISTPERQLHWLKFQVSKVLKLASMHGFGDEVQRACDAKEQALTDDDKKAWAALQVRREAENKTSEGGAL